MVLHVIGADQVLLTFDDGTKMEADKCYVVAGLATVGAHSPDEPIWDTVAIYLREQWTLKMKKLNTPKLVGVEGDPRLVGYPA